MAATGKTGHDVAQAIGAAAATVLPHEDVRGYLQQAILPVLGPAIEELLHYVHESGELQRLLRERAEQESQNNRPNRRQQLLTSAPVEAMPTSGKGEADRSLQIKANAIAPASNGANGAAAVSAGLAAEDGAPVDTAETDDAVEPPSFDPLVWLSECLAAKASGPASQYREQIEQRIKLKLQEEDASIIEEGEEEVTEGGSLPGDVGRVPVGSAETGDSVGGAAAAASKGGAAHAE